MSAQPRSSITEHTLEGRHGHMRYWASLPRRGVPVLLIHGYGGLIEHWRRVMPSIVRAHTLYALDLYGFGFSARPRVPPSKELWATQVADVLQQVETEPAVIVGHSMGGVVAAHFAATYPQLTRGLVLVNSAGLPAPHQPSVLDQVLARMLQADGVGEMLAGFFGNSWWIRQFLLASYHRKECVTPELVDAFTAPLREPDGMRYYLATSRAVESLTLQLRPGDVQVPTLLVWGAHDRSLPVSVAYSFKEQLFPDAEIRLIADTGHCPFDEDPEAFCAALLTWIDQRCRARENDMPQP